MNPEAFVRAMPKVELHVHLEGSIQPATLLHLAERHGVRLPADTVDEVREWYRFTDFDHFIEVYLTISGCVRTAEDIELIAREFLKGQAEQNIVYSEVTYTAFTHYLQKGLSFEEQLEALNRARRWAEEELDVTMRYIIDIPRNIDSKHGPLIAEWAVSGMNDGVVALGLGGPEAGNPPEKFLDAFQIAAEAGLPAVPHAGETAGAASVRSAVEQLKAVRIGHGVRSLEDPELVEMLRERRIPLEVCPTSNVCLGVAPSFVEHPLPRLIDAGLVVTLNSDDPPMFNTTLTREYETAARCFGLEPARLMQFTVDAARVSLADPPTRDALLNRLGATAEPAVPGAD